MMKPAEPEEYTEPSAVELYLGRADADPDSGPDFHSLFIGEWRGKLKLLLWVLFPPE